MIIGKMGLPFIINYERGLTYFVNEEDAKSIYLDIIGYYLNELDAEIL